jgi:hypothetical protein
MESLTGDEFTDRLVPVASRLIGAVREWDDDEACAAIEEAQEMDPQFGLLALVVLLAAMVPYDKSAGDLLAWVKRRYEFDRLVEIGVDPASAATIVNSMQ